MTLSIFKAEIISAIKDVIKGSTSIKSMQWLKSSEVRKLIGISPGKLKTIRDNGLISFTRVGGNIYYNQDDLIKLFNDNKNGGAKK